MGAKAGRRARAHAAVPQQLYADEDGVKAAEADAMGGAEPFSAFYDEARGEAIL